MSKRLTDEQRKAMFARRYTYRGRRTKVKPGTNVVNSQVPRGIINVNAPALQKTKTDELIWAYSTQKLSPAVNWTILEILKGRGYTKEQVEAVAPTKTTQEKTEKPKARPKTRTTYETLQWDGQRYGVNFETKEEADAWKAETIKIRKERGQETSSIESLKFVPITSRNYSIGDMWRSDFDYEGMLQTALETKMSWSPAKLQKVYNSLEDVNYHTESKFLRATIESLKAGNLPEADKHLSEFHAAVKETLGGSGDAALNAALNANPIQQKKPDYSEDIKKLDNEIVWYESYIKRNKGILDVTTYEDTLRYYKSKRADLSGK